MPLDDPKYSVLTSTDKLGRYIRKLVAVGWQGARCHHCGRRFDPRKKDEASWNFAHIDAMRNGADQGDRWGHQWKDETLFTVPWRGFMDRVVLVCSLSCNHAVEGGVRPVNGHQITFGEEDPTIWQMRQLELFREDK